METDSSPVAEVPKRVQATEPSLVAELVAVSKRYGATQALNRATLAVRRGSSHALVGRNGAGKSTLVGVLTGVVTPDSGSVRIAGREISVVERLGTNDVACVYQRPQILPHLSVAENLLLNKDRPRWTNWPRTFDRAAAILAEWGVDVDPRRLAGDLNVEQQQLVEIARALSSGSSLVVLDEPTARLDRHAIDRLFERLAKLKARGATFLFISHHLDEVFRICDDVTVMRDGTDVASMSATDLNVRQLVRLMVGEDEGTKTDGSHGRAAPTPSEDSAEPALVADALSDGSAFHDVTFSVRHGEIVAIAGLAGSGKREVAEAVVGLRDRAGSVCVAGRMVRPASVTNAIDLGIGYVPEDRHDAGFAPDLTIAENLTTSVMPRLGRWGWILPRRRAELARRLVTDLDVVPPRLGTEVRGLSGGNQQKVVMGRALAGNPSVVVAITPTAGVDIASKTFLYQRLIRAADAGAGVLIVSDELDELALADRVMVMFDGRIRATFRRPWRSRDLIEAIEGASHIPAPESDDDDACERNG